MSLELHTPVLLAETLDALAPYPGARMVDCTVNGGGHSAGILERTAPDGRLLALDADPQVCKRPGRRFRGYGNRVEVIHSNFRHIGRVAAASSFTGVDGILMDLGFSSRQIDSPERGFSFQGDGPLDMRYDTSAGRSAAEYLATASREEIETALRSFGEEPRARSIATRIVARREHEPIRTTAELAQTVSDAVGGRDGRIHPATRTFQALRILVNDELGALQEALPQTIELMRRGGRLAVITFHSLEDRIVKVFLRRQAGEAEPSQLRNLPITAPPAAPTLRLVSRRAIFPSEDEIARNPRSRSAHLRVAERV